MSQGESGKGSIGSELLNHGGTETRSKTGWPQKAQKTQNGLDAEDAESAEVPDRNKNARGR